MTCAIIIITRINDMIDTSKRVGSSWPDIPKQQPYRYGRRAGGRYTIVPYASLSQAQIDNMAAQADLLGLNYEFENTFGGKSTITIEYPYNFAQTNFPSVQTESEDMWEISSQKAMKDLLDSRNPLVVAAMAEPNGVQAVNLMKKWKSEGSLKDYLVVIGTDTSDDGRFFRQYVSPIEPPVSLGAIGKAKGSHAQFYPNCTVLSKFLLDGIEQVEIPAPVLIHTKTVTAQYIYPAQFLNVGRIFSSPTLITTEGIPPAILFDFPNDVDPSPTEIGGVGANGLYQAFLYGWLKNSPSVRQVSARKWNITQTWDYGLWAMQLYGSVRL